MPDFIVTITLHDIERSEAILTAMAVLQCSPESNAISIKKIKEDK